MNLYVKTINEPERDAGIWVYRSDEKVAGPFELEDDAQRHIEYRRALGRAALAHAKALGQVA